MVTAPTAPVYDPSVLAALPMVADGTQPGFVDEMLRLFDTACLEALDELAQALARHDGAALQRRLHTFKSSCAQVGAMELSALAARFELELRAGGKADPAWLVSLRQAHARYLKAAAR